MQNVTAACTNDKLEFSFSPACMIIIYLRKIIVERIVFTGFSVCVRDGE